MTPAPRALAYPVLAAAGLILAGAMAWSAYSAAADEVAAQLDRAKAELAAGHAVKAYLSVANLLADLSARTPLFLTAAVFVQGPSRGYGQYDLRPHNVFTRDEPMLVYLEPSGFDHAKEGELYRISLACDYAVLDAKGKLLTTDRTLKEIDLVSHQANSEMAIDLRLPYFDLAPGNYVLELQVRDRLAGDNAKVRLNFRRI